MSLIPASSPEVARVARQKLHFDQLRPGQEEAVRTLLQGRDTLLVQPTGSGKSAVYQLAGLMIDGATVIVSPLIALQKDQLDSIGRTDSAPGALVNSMMKTAEAREALVKLREGDLEYLFLAPEQLCKQETLQALKEAEISLFVVDEAHCVSEWGHDFRPDYLRIGAIVEELGHPVVLCMTATASPEVRNEIIARAGLRNPKVFVHGFDRPNIALRVDHFNEEEEKFEGLVHRVRWAEKPGIVYVSTRRNAEAIMGALATEGVNAVFYHAGLRAKERNLIQERFMNGEADVIVATSAFGMGIDKENVRFVYHFDITDSVDSYYQEIGRAGRDGKASEATLFYRRQNIAIHKFQSGAGKLTPEIIGQVAAFLRDAAKPVTARTIVEGTRLSQSKVNGALRSLEDAGAVVSSPKREVELVPDRDLSEAAQTAADLDQAHRERKRRRLEEMEGYAMNSGCRRAFILNYFGDESPSACGNCDNCLGAAGEQLSEAGAGTRREVQ